jgi:hypothetical protein
MIFRAGKKNKLSTCSYDRPRLSMSAKHKSRPRTCQGKLNHPKPSRMHSRYSRLVYILLVHHHDWTYFSSKKTVTEKITPRGLPLMTIGS